MKLYRYFDYFVFENVSKHACLNQDEKTNFCFLQFFMAAIMNLQLLVRSGSIGSSYVDLENVGISVQIASLSCMRTEL